MAYSEAAEVKLGVTDHPSHPETGGGAEGEKKPTKLSDFDLQLWVSVLCWGIDNTYRTVLFMVGETVPI